VTVEPFCLKYVGGILCCSKLQTVRHQAK